ncbi:MAG: glycosyltransferase family 4 protein, partial [Rhodothermales bacterium]
VPKIHRFDVPGARQIGEVVAARRPRAVIWHSAYAPLTLRREVRRDSTRSLVFVEHQALHLRSLPHNIRSLVAAHIAHSVVFLSDEYRRNYPFRSLPVRALRRAATIPNGVDLDTFSPLPSASSEEKGEVLRIGMMGRMTPTKDFLGLVRAAARLRREQDCPPFQLLLAGDGTERSKLQEAVKALDVEDFVTLLGHLSEQHLVEFLHSLDVYVHATHGETMSTAILQAYACGLPVVASDVGGVTNLVDDGVDGLLTPAHDPASLASLLRDLLASPQRRSALGTAARRRAIAEFGVDRMARRYLELLAQLDPSGPWTGTL